MSMVLDALPQAALVVTEGGRVVLRNAAADSLLPAGSEVAAVLEGPAASAIHWDSEMTALAESAGRLSRRNIPMTGKGDRQLTVDVHLGAILLPNGDAAGAGSTGPRDPWVLVLVEDTSPRVSMERRVATGERIAAAGTLAAKVAHELNNPLDGALRFVGLAERVANPEASEYLRQARAGLHRMAEIIRGLLEQGQAWRRAGERTPVQRLLDEAVRTMQPRAQTGGVAVVCDFDGRVDGAVEGGSFQVFCNVIKNALDAMPNGGMLTITLVPDGARCRIEFSDTGAGLTDEEAERIFEPFYTTKSPAQGSGLGLAICREIVGRVGGTITAHSRAEGGLTVAVSLPLHPAWGPSQQEPES